RRGPRGASCNDESRWFTHRPSRCARVGPSLLARYPLGWVMGAVRGSRRPVVSVGTVPSAHHVGIRQGFGPARGRGPAGCISGQPPTEGWTAGAWGRAPAVDGKTLRGGLDDRARLRV